MHVPTTNKFNIASPMDPRTWPWCRKFNLASPIDPRTWSWCRPGCAFSSPTASPTGRRTLSAPRPRRVPPLAARRLTWCGRTAARWRRKPPARRVRVDGSSRRGSGRPVACRGDTALGHGRGDRGAFASPAAGDVSRTSRSLCRIWIDI